METGRASWQTELRADAGAPADARSFVRSTIGPLSSDVRLDLAALLTSELVSNAVRHTPVDADTIQLTVSVASSGGLKVEVADPGPGFDPDAPSKSRGYGLRLVDAISTRWGVERAPAGTSVWFELG
jgi:two-component sensor histidine kinase